MERFLRPIYQEHASDANTLGIILMERTKSNSPVTEDFDGILLIIVQNAEQQWQAKHYEFEDERSAAVHIVTEPVLMEWIDTSGYRRAVEWVIYGRVIFDRNEYVYNLKNQLRDFPSEKRDLRKAIEFGKLVKSYSEAKDLYETEEYKDANSKILYSLHYLARLAVIEKGYYPEVTVWSQVKQIDLEVYKLYEEFIESREEIKKRIQLMLLAMDFIISNRAKTSVKHLLEIMGTKEEPWSYVQLKTLPETSSYSLDLTAVISFMVEKGLLVTVKEQTKGIGVYHRKYVVKK